MRQQLIIIGLVSDCRRVCDVDYMFIRINVDGKKRICTRRPTKAIVEKTPDHALLDADCLDNSISFLNPAVRPIYFILGRVFI
jgi:hypothetical protein